jgi:hypothetical protein
MSSQSEYIDQLARQAVVIVKGETAMGVADGIQEENRMAPISAIGDPSELDTRTDDRSPMAILRAARFDDASKRNARSSHGDSALKEAGKERGNFERRLVHRYLGEAEIGLTLMNI